MSHHTISHILLTLRIILFVLTVSAGIIALMVGSQAALAASLKDSAVVETDTLTLGDLFDGLDHNRDYVLGAAPQPGQDMVLGARTLYRIAKAMNLPWRPSNAAEQITVRRTATVIPPGRCNKSNPKCSAKQRGGR